MTILNQYKSFVINYLPFKWENTIQKTGMIKFKTTLEISFLRFFKIYSLLHKILQSNNKISKIIDRALA